MLRRIKQHFSLKRNKGIRASKSSDILQLDRRVTLGERRLKIAEFLDQHFHSTVAYGPLKGFKFDPKTWWNKKDRGGMLLGLYEQEVLNCLASPPDTHRTFIDLGAADGYYGVGVLVNRIFDESYCFEMSHIGREVIQANAALNHVKDRIHLRGKANPDFYFDIPAEKRAACVLLIDIEGGEFDLLTNEVLNAFKQSIILIELHPELVDNGEQRLKELYARTAQYFDLKIVKTGARDLSCFPVLEQFSDDNRWLVCSESRKTLMSWLILKPRTNTV